MKAGKSFFLWQYEKRGDEMDDKRIIDLYFARDELAIDETRVKYGKLLEHIALNILNSHEDSEECVNDTYMKAWQSMPPTRPNILSAFLCKITRNLSINRYIQNRARRKGLSADAVFEEIAECIPDTSGPISDTIALRDAINGFLARLPETARKIFVKRYFYMMSVKEIALEFKITANYVKVSLLRTREKFKEHLEKAGITL